MADLSCPEGGGEVPRSGLASQAGTGAGPVDEPPMERTICPECRAHLERASDDDDAAWSLRGE